MAVEILRDITARKLSFLVNCGTRLNPVLFRLISKSLCLRMVQFMHFNGPSQKDVHTPRTPRPIRTIWYNLFTLCSVHLAERQIRHKCTLVTQANLGSLQLFDLLWTKCVIDWNFTSRKNVGLLNILPTELWRVTLGVLTFFKANLLVCL